MLSVVEMRPMEVTLEKCPMELLFKGIHQLHTLSRVDESSLILNNVEEPYLAQ